MISVARNPSKARFVDEIRNLGTSEVKYKIRFIAQAYRDKAQGLLTYDPTVQRSYQRIFVHVTAGGIEILYYFIQGYSARL